MLARLPHSLTRKIATGLGLVITFPILVLFLLWLWLQTDTGMATLVSYIERTASSHGSTLSLGPVTGSFPTDITVQQISMKEKDGTELFHIDNATLHWSPLKLLSGTVHIDLLSADNVAITPVSSNSNSSVDIAALFAHLPQIRIEALDIKKLALDMGEHHFSYRIYGGVAPGNHAASITTSLQLETEEGPNSHASLDIRYNPTHQFFAIKAALEEEAGGGIGTLLGLPADQGFALQLQGKGPLKRWSGTYDFHLGGDLLIAGDVLLFDKQKGLHISLDGALTPPKRFLPASLHDWLAPDEAINYALDALLENGSTIQIPAAALSTSRHQIQFAGQQANHQLEGTVSGALTPPPALAPYLGSSTRFTFRLLQNKENIALNDLYTTLAQGHLSGNGHFTMADHRLDAMLAYNYLDNLQAKGHFSGKLDDLAAQLDMSGKNLVLSGHALPAFQSTLTLHHLPHAGEGDITLTVNDGKQQYQLQSALALDSTQVSLRPLQFTAPAMKLEGGVRFDMASKLLAGEITGGGSLATLKPLLRQDISGKLELKASLTPVKGKQEAALSLKTTSLSLAALKIAQTDFSLQLRDLFTTPGIEASLQAKDLSAPGIAANSVALKAKGTTSQLDFTGNGQMVAQAPLQFTTKGSVSMKAGTTSLALQEFSGSYNKHPFKLLKPATLKTSPAETLLSDTLLRYAGAEAKLAGRYTPRTSDISLQVNHLALADLPLSATGALNGKIKGSLTVTGARTSPLARLSLTIAGLGSTNEKVKLPPFQLQTDAEIKGGTFNGTATLSSGNDKQAEARLHFPATLSLAPYRLTLPPEGALSGQVNAAIDAKLLNPMLSADNSQRLSGKLQANCQLKGQLMHPELQGNASIINGSYEHDVFGVVLQNINTELKATGTQVTIASASLTDGDKGRASASGSFNIANLSSPMNIAVQLNKFYLLHRDTLNMRAQGTAALTGSLQAPRLEGNITIDRANIVIPDRIPPSITQLNTTRVNVPPALEAVKKVPFKETGMASILNLKLELQFPNRVFLRGQGLDTELSGKLSITGNASDPLINGALHTIRGRYSFAGQGFELTSGTASFRGAVPPSPFLDIMAEAPADDITAQVHFTGTLDHPKIVITSTPPMPSDEVLSRLLFGKNLKTISPTQAYRLVSVTRQMMGGGNENNMLDRVRNLLRLDDLDIKQDDQGSSAVGVGKYIQKGVYVGAQKNLTTTGGKANVEINLTRHITLESEIGSVTKDLGTPAAQTNTEEGIGLNWKYDY